MNTAAFLIVASALALAGVVPAGAQTVSPDTGTVDTATTGPATDPLEQIPHTLKALEEAKAGKYGKLRAADSQLLAKADRDIYELMQRHDDLHQLDAQEKTQLFNAQETIMGIVSGLKRSQLVCTYKQEPGTRFKTKHCVTRDMADTTKRGAKDAVHDMQNRMCVPGEGNSC
jgi:hypothetical protein